MTEKIKKFLNLINQWKVILIILLIIFGLFYWFQIRPSKIYSKCSDFAWDALGIYIDDTQVISEMGKITLYDFFIKIV